MLVANEIESQLGASIVTDIETAIARGLAVAEHSAHPHLVIEAMRYLLLQMLAAAVITPIDGAKNRARDLGLDLVDLVDEAVASQDLATD